MKSVALFAIAESKTIDIPPHLTGRTAHARDHNGGDLPTDRLYSVVSPDVCPRLVRLRLSCSLCVLAKRKDLVRAAQLRPELAAEYAELETEIGHRFRNDVSIADIITAAKQAGTAKISGKHRTPHAV